MISLKKQIKIISEFLIIYMFISYPLYRFCVKTFTLFKAVDYVCAFGEHKLLNNKFKKYA